jgi:hypothetical protein
LLFVGRHFRDFTRLNARSKHEDSGSEMLEQSRFLSAPLEAGFGQVDVVLDAAAEISSVIHVGCRCQAIRFDQE